jgi:limonene-1,2-epoxide hydrolase
MTAAPNSKIATIHRMQAALSRRDKDAFLDFFAPNIEYHYHVGTRPLIGREWVGKFIIKYWADNANSTWVIERHAEAGDFLMTEGREEYVNASGDIVIHRYMGVITFGPDGRITDWKDYFQMADPNAAH